MKAQSAAQKPVIAQNASTDNAGVNWKREAAVAATTVAATAAGVYGGMELGAHFLADHVAAATEGHGLFAILTAPVEALRGLFTTVLPWAAGTGAVSGTVGCAVGRAAFKGAPLTDESASIRD